MERLDRQIAPQKWRKGPMRKRKDGEWETDGEMKRKRKPAIGRGEADWMD